MQLKGHKFSGGLEKQTVEAFGTRCFAGSLMPNWPFAANSEEKQLCTSNECKPLSLILLYKTEEI